MKKSILLTFLLLLTSGLITYFFLTPQPCGYTDENGVKKIECKCIGLAKSINVTKGPVVWGNSIDICYGYTTTKLCSSISKGQISVKQYDEPVLCSSLSK